MGQKLSLLVWNHTAKLHRVTAKDSEDRLSLLVEVEIGQHTKLLPALSTDTLLCSTEPPGTAEGILAEGKDLT